MGITTLPALNSNLILLIPNYDANIDTNVLAFKFQSDSINTITNMIRTWGKISFKFQSDSINTILRA